MTSFDSESSIINDWIDAETTQLDVVASWESLCDTYRMLEFSDQISDTVRMEEFKWIIKEMNKHLTRSRKQLLACENIDAIQTVLMNLYTPTGGVTLTSRKEVAYHKLRQSWVRQMLNDLESVVESIIEMEGNGNAERE